MGPNFSHIEDIPLVFLRSFGGHQLDIDIPDRIVTAFDSFKHILNHVVWIFPGNFSCFIATEVLDPLSSFHMDFGIMK